ncbi:MAG: methyltransferase domain-containing protein [Verrucomicrobia bacterium]|nr:methyltransferase domain-containing protein [Verrucomicrobiota bacterium]MDA1005296.1 methyltransferase domain-containing protein [Verrucomicrobiota bacterium]
MMNAPNLQDFLQFPVEILCPRCQKEQLFVEGDQIRCPHCEASFGFEDRIADLIVGDRFPDEIQEEELLYEDECIRDATNNYWLPTFLRHTSRGNKPLQVLSLGCGTGIDIDLLTDEGFSTMGIDNGNRTRLWTLRKYPNRLLLANGLHMPFADNTFDLIYCGCVFPHIGVEGDSYKVTDHYLEERQLLANEMVRVTKPGGQLFMASPNRLFPLDIFHGRTQGKHIPRCNVSMAPFLLSTGDYRKLFLKAGCHSVNALPSKGYWGFLRSGRSLKGRLISLPVRTLFSMTSSLKVLHGSFFNPWIVVHIHMSR